MRGGKSTMMIKAALLLAVIGHILCGVCDCLLSYSPKGRLNLKDIRDPEKMRALFEGMPLSYPMASIVMGTFAILMFSFGYFALSFWMRQFSPAAANILFVSAAVFLIPITTHHVFCGAVEWLYLRLGRTGEARDAVLGLQKKSIVTMFVGYAGLLVFTGTLFFMTVAGKTAVPRWGCVFNTLAFLPALLPTGLPAKGNIAGALMFLGLLFILP